MKKLALALAALISVAIPAVAATNGVFVYGTGNIATSQVTVTTTATLVAAARSGRGTAIIENTGTTALYVGPAGVTTTTGMLVPGTVGANLTVSTTAPVYGITASGTAVVSVLETY